LGNRFGFHKFTADLLEETGLLTEKRDLGISFKRKNPGFVAGALQRT
jgi:hypothetical protein